MFHQLSAWLLGLAPFWQDVIKLVLDKVLLGAVAAWIVYRFARSLEKQKSRTAVELERSKQRDLAIMNAWNAIRRLELELINVEHKFEPDLSQASLLPPGPPRRLPEAVAKRLDEAQRAAAEAVGRERPRLPKELFDVFVEIHNARVALVRAYQPVNPSAKQIEELKSQIVELEERAKVLVEKHLGAVPTQ